MAVTIKEVADYAGVSSATVSMVLNNRSGFSEETKDKIIHAVRELGYQPPMTKRVNQIKNRALPLVIFKKHGGIIDNSPFFSQLIESIEREAKFNGFTTSIHYVSKKEEVSGIYAEDMGFLVLATELGAKDCAAFDKLGVPHVFIDNSLLGVSANKVLVGNIQGAYKAVAELYRLGHRQIGHLQGNGTVSNYRERRTGFNFAIRDYTLEQNKSWKVSLSGSHQGAYEEMLIYCRKNKDLPTAFFADNDMIAIGAMKALKEQGYKVPEDISIIGFDNIPYCTMVEPNLSTMGVDTQNMGIIAVRLLLDKMHFPQKIELEANYIHRGSVIVKRL